MTRTFQTILTHIDWFKNCEAQMSGSSDNTQFGLFDTAKPEEFQIILVYEVGLENSLKEFYGQ